MNYSSEITNSINRYSSLKIIDAQKLYHEKYSNIPEPTFFKIFSRLENCGVVKRISRGVYCKPKLGKFGLLLPNEKNIIEHYIGHEGNKGMVVGYHLFNKYGLTTQISKIVEMYSTEIMQKSKVVKNVKIQRVNIKLDFNTIKLIELLEILQEHENIEDLNVKMLWNYLEEASRYFTEKSLSKILQSMPYKKSTLASLESVLSYYGIENSVSKYLVGTSRYNAISMEGLYEVTLQKR